jgi:ubiquinone/menaquinone biosynthesis C-methylase UbiE
MTTEAHEKSKAVWDEMAAGWERYRDFMWETSGHVAEWLVDHVDAHEGDTILDLAGGPGDNGFLAVRHVGPSGKVIETDFAPQMVDVARRRASDLGLGNVETRTLDAEQMDLPDDSVDGIICRWGYMLMQQPDVAMAESRRVLKDGGRLALSVWSTPESNPWVTVTGMTMVQLGHQPGGDPFGAGGMFSLSDHDKLRSMLMGAGFTSVEIEDMPVLWRYDSFDQAWEFMTSVAGAIAAAVKEFPADEIERLRTTLETNVQPYLTDSGLVLPGVTTNAVAS